MRSRGATYSLDSRQVTDVDTLRKEVDIHI